MNVHTSERNSYNKYRPLPTATRSLDDELLLTKKHGCFVATLRRRYCNRMQYTVCGVRDTVHNEKPGLVVDEEATRSSYQRSPLPTPPSPPRAPYRVDLFDAFQKERLNSTPHTGETRCSFGLAPSSPPSLSLRTCFFLQERYLECNAHAASYTWKVLQDEARVYEPLLELLFVRSFCIDIRTT